MRIRLARASGATFGVDDISCAAATQLGLFAAQGLDVQWSDSLALDRDHGDKLRRMLDFDELKRLVPLQPHGVLATTEAFERAQPQALLGLTIGMIQASRALHERFEVFRGVLEEYVSVKLSTEEARLLWQREHDGGGWAVNGELTPGHWDAQIALFHELNPFR